MSAVLTKQLRRSIGNCVSCSALPAIRRSGRNSKPTRGIDVGAKAQIQKLVTDLAADGMGVVFISAEFDEVARISDRIAVLRDGHCVAKVGSECTVRELTALIASGSHQ